MLDDRDNELLAPFHLSYCARVRFSPPRPCDCSLLGRVEAIIGSHVAPAAVSS